MRSCPEVPYKLYLVAFVLILIPVCSAWTCNAFIGFDSCQTSVPQPQITALSPNAVPADAASVQLAVDGTGFVRHSEILRNGNSLQTTFTDSPRLQGNDYPADSGFRHTISSGHKHRGNVLFPIGDHR